MLMGLKPLPTHPHVPQTLTHPILMCSNTILNPTVCLNTIPTHPYIHPNTSLSHLHIPPHISNPSPSTPKRHHSIFMWPNSFFTKSLFFLNSVPPHFHVPWTFTHPIPMYHNTIPIPSQCAPTHHPIPFYLNTILPNPHVPHTAPALFECAPTYLYVAQHHHTLSPMCPNTISNPTHLP